MSLSKSLKAFFEIALVIAPFAAVAVFRDYWDFLYKGPLAIVAGALIASYFLYRNGERWRDLGFRRPESWVNIALGVVLCVGALIAVQYVLVVPASESLDLGEPDLSALAVVRVDFVTFLIFLGPLSWGSAAFGEEFIARGFILNRIAVAAGGTRAAWLTAAVIQAVIFGLAHSWQGLAGMIATGVVGLVFGLAYLLIGRNLWLTIITHGLFDSVTVVAIYIGSFEVG